MFFFQKKHSHTGASYRQGDGIGHIIPGMKGNQLKATITFMECHFDAVCDIDEKEIELNRRVKKHSMMNAIIKTITFIPEFFLILALQGDKEAYARYEMQRLYWAFIRGKINEKDVVEGSSVLALELIERLKNK